MEKNVNAFFYSASGMGKVVWDTEDIVEVIPDKLSDLLCLEKVVFASSAISN